MKDYEVVGWAGDGEVYCADCCNGDDPGGEDSAFVPVFAGSEDATTLTCGECGTALLESD